MEPYAAECDSCGMRVCRCFVFVRGLGCVGSGCCGGSKGTMEKPDVYILSQVAWQFWITLTLKNAALNSEKLRQSLWFALLRGLAGWYRVDFNRLLWVRRAELGETSARLHWHALVGGLPDVASHRATCFAIKNYWEKLGGGIARVYLYDSSRNALDYMFPPESLEGTSCSMSSGAVQYESAKFGKSDQVTFSEGVLRLLHRRRGIGRKFRMDSRLRECTVPATTKHGVVTTSQLPPSLCSKGINGALSHPRREALPE